MEENTKARDRIAYWLAVFYCFYSFASMSMMSVMVEPIKSAFGINSTTLGALSATLLFAYALWI